MALIYSQLGNMLSMKRKRFKAQSHARLGYPAKCHDTYPTRKAASLRRRGASPISKESTR